MKYSERMYIVNIIFVFTSVLAVSISSDVTNNIDINGCVLPKYPKNGEWSIGSDSKHASGTHVENGVIISITCDSRYIFNGSSVLKCESGKWSAEIGQCLELCPPIIEKHSTIVTCTTSNGGKANCSTPTNGTIATIKCAPFYENEELNINPFRICKNGRWNENILSCSPVCGVDPTSTTNGTLKNFYPWNILIYKKIDKEKKLLGFGTLITEKVVLTSATALMNYSNFPYGDLYSFDNMMLAAGKSIEDFEDFEPQHAQYSMVQDVFVPDMYNGLFGNFVADLAIIIANLPFKMTSRVQIACVDWSKEYKTEFSQVAMSTKIAKVSAPLKSLEHNLTQAYEIVAPLPFELECFHLLAQSSDVLNISLFPGYNFIYNAVDKYCGQNISVSKFSNCGRNINPGVGLITKNSFNGKYYIIGVASLGSMDNECRSITEFTLFTRIYEYISYIKKKTNLYSTIERNQFQTSCGTKSVQAQPLIVNGSTVTKGEYPWQVAIYDVSDTKKRLICGGSLINQRVVLTAAHCVANERGDKLPKEKYIIAVGKYYRNFDDSRDNNFQFSAVKEIFVPSDYKSLWGNYLGDIAILISKISFKLSAEIQPICVDWEAKYEAQFLKPNITGFVAGWGYTQENQSPSEELKDLEVRYVDPEQCKNELPKDYEIFLTRDKLCSGVLNKGKSVCRGDSGGGLVFKNRNDGRYYLAGIVSVSPQSPTTGGCDSQQYTLYTRISNYVPNFVREKVSLYWS